MCVVVCGGEGDGRGARVPPSIEVEWSGGKEGLHRTVLYSHYRLLHSSPARLTTTTTTCYYRHLTTNVCTPQSPPTLPFIAILPNTSTPTNPTRPNPAHLPGLWEAGRGERGGEGIRETPPKKSRVLRCAVLGHANSPTHAHSVPLLLKMVSSLPFVAVTAVLEYEESTRVRGEYESTRSRAAPLPFPPLSVSVSLSLSVSVSLHPPVRYCRFYRRFGYVLPLGSYV